MSQIGWHQSSDRGVYELDVASAGDVPRFLSVASRYFVCLLAWDARHVGVTEISAVVNFLIRSGCVYICCWGPDCERVHDIFDEVEVDLCSGSDGPCLMSTWHAHELLSEALWFSLFSARPDDAFAAECRSLVGLSIHSPEWAAEIRDAFANPAGLSERLGYGSDPRL